MVFRGREQHAIDAKGRTAMPARFRDVLFDSLPQKQAASLVLVPWFGDCIRVYQADAWARREADFDARIAELDAFDADEEISDLRRVMFGGAIETQMDGHGRIVLTRPLREELGLSDEVYWVGAGPYLEIWDPATFRARFQGERARNLLQRLGRLGGQRPSAHGAEGDGDV